MRAGLPQKEPEILARWEKEGLYGALRAKAKAEGRPNFYDRRWRDKGPGDAPKGGFWGNMGDYMVSLLKAWWGDAATSENEFAFRNLPQLTGDHSIYPIVMGMQEGDVEGDLPEAHHVALVEALVGRHGPCQERDRARRQSPEYKERQRQRRMSPEYKELNREWQRKRKLQQQCQLVCEQYA